MCVLFVTVWVLLVTVCDFAILFCNLCVTIYDVFVFLGVIGYDVFEAVFLNCLKYIQTCRYVLGSG